MTTRTREIADRLAKATPGPWAIDPGTNGQDLVSYALPWRVTAYIAGRIEWHDNMPANLSLVSNAPADISYLLERNARLEEALRKMAGCEMRVTGDVIDVARQALKETDQ